MMERTVRFELRPQTIDSAVDEVQRDMAHIAECSGAEDPAACVVDVEIIAVDGDSSAYLVVVEYGGDQPVGIPVCVSPVMTSVKDCIARFRACRPDFAKRVLH